MTDSYVLRLTAEEVEELEELVEYQLFDLQRGPYEDDLRRRHLPVLSTLHNKLRVLRQKASIY